MRQHLVLVLQLHAKHRVRQRLDHGGHHFDGVFLPARIARFLNLLFWPSLHALPGTTRLKLLPPCFPPLVPLHIRCFRDSPNRPRCLFRPRQDPWPVLRNCHRMFEMRRIAAVRRYRRPVIRQHPDSRSAGIHHRLDRQDHSLLQLRPMPRCFVIPQLPILMHLGADAMTYKFPHHRKTAFLHPLLHGRRNIAQPVSRPDLIDRLLQRFARHPQQLLALRADLPYRNRHRRVAKITIQLDAKIHRKNVAFFQLPRRRWYPVHHFLVNRSAHRARIPAVALERRLGLVLDRVSLGERVQILRRNSRLHHLAHLSQSAVHHLPRAVHLFQFRRRFTDDHRFLPRASVFHSGLALPDSLPRRHPPPAGFRAPGNNRPAAKSASGTPRIVPSQFPAGRPNAGPTSRRRYRKSLALSARARKCCTSRRLCCRSTGPPPASAAFPG